MTTVPPPPSSKESRLESWKEIAAYLNRDARTVRRWEQSEGLPVHRHRHLARSSVYAFPSELDAWRAKRKPEPRAGLEPRRRSGWRLASVAAAVIFTMSSGGGGRFLGSLAAGQTPGQVGRQLWAGPAVDTSGGMSRDGRWLSYGDGSGEVIVRDIRSGREQRIAGKLSTEAADGRPYTSILSPDGSRVIVQWQRPNPQHASIRIMDASPGAPVKVLYDNPEIGWIAPFDWSPDGKWIAVQFRQNRAGNIGLLSTVHGTLKPLKSVAWAGSSGLAFSPDGRRLAYDLPAAQRSSGRHIFILDVDGTRESAIVVHASSNKVMGWTADGSALLFASDRSGRTALYAIRLADGKPSGSAELIKPDMGRLKRSFGVDRSGALIFATQTAARTIESTEVDFATGKLVAGISRPVDTYLWASREPDWSRDGKSLLYKLEKPESRTVLAIRDLSTGATRELVPELTEFVGPTWAPDGSIVVLGNAARGQQGFYRLDPASGTTTLLHPMTGLMGATFFLSPDGQTVYYRVRTAGAAAIRALDLKTGDEKTVGPGAPFALSADGKSIGYLEIDGAAGTAILKVMPVAGGEARVLHQFEKGHGLLAMLRWTPDSQRLVYGRWIDKRETPTAFSIPAAGGVPVELDARIPGHPSLALHPDGRRVAFEGGNTAYEVWALENFLKR